MTKMDVKRIGKNFGYFARSLPKMEEHEYCQRARAILEHHFDNHENCGDWCKRRRLSQEEALASERYYRCKTKDKDLYDALSPIVNKYITLQRLKEIAHGMDTNANESINNTISYFAPKKQSILCHKISSNSNWNCHWDCFRRISSILLPRL